MSGVNSHMHTGRAASRRAGLSLLEVVMSTLMVGIVLVGAMNLLGAAVKGRTTTADQARAEQLAQRLMTEVLSNGYEEPDVVLLGIDAGETSLGRWFFDDVDDYDGLNVSPLENRVGQALTNTTGWRQTVEVDFVTVANPAVTTNTDEGLKRITVTIYRGAAVAARLVALRSDRYDL